MTDERPIKLEITLTEREAALLAGWTVPGELCGPSLAERVRFLIDDACQHLESAERRQEQSKLYRLFSLPDPNATGDDEIPF